MQAVEFFAGIGGFSVAAKQCRIATEVAIDIDATAAKTFRRNLAAPYLLAEIATLPTSRIEQWSRDLWWASPPCLPFTIKGKRLGESDPRSEAFKRLMSAAIELQPERLLIENVPGFSDSELVKQWEKRLIASGYSSDWLSVCPTQFGYLNRRRREYWILLRPGHARIAADDLVQSVPPAVYTSVDDVLTELSDEARSLLELPPDIVHRYRSALSRVDGSTTITACFAAGYGRQWLRSGSYLVEGNTLRRFAPREIARLLGFPDDFVFSSDIELTWANIRTDYRHLGNSVAIGIIIGLLRCLAA